MARVTTGRGDEGYTDLLGPRRVPKYHPRPEAYGTVDEATSALGLARAHLAGRPEAERIYAIQRDLYTLMAELATPPEVYDKATWRIEDQAVTRLETWEDDLKKQVEIGKEFIIPGGSVAGATLDLARTIVRRAERQVARLYHDGEVTNAAVLRYLNRLSDYLFILARRVEADPD